MEEEATDAELLALFRKEDSRNYAFNRIVQKHQRRLYAFIRRMVTDPDETKDVLQEVFLKAWTGLDKFREDAQLFSWLYRIAHNEAFLSMMPRSPSGSPPPWMPASTSAARPSSASSSAPS
jgi:RNA polymerase sigma-70 factor (ECF subfamily)